MNLFVKKEMIPLFSYTAFPATFNFVISHVATAALPLPKPKNVSEIPHVKFGNHFKNSF